MELVFASNNEHKLKEIQNLLPGAFKLLTLSQAGIDQELQETGDTLEENALQKARQVYELTGKNCFSDDTGLVVPALNGEPGVRSARYAGEERSAEKNMKLLLDNLSGAADRSAYFSTVIALILDGKEYFFSGNVHGRIIKEKRGSEGFGYDPVFIPEGGSQTFAEMSSEEKNRISHRGRAVKKLVDFLSALHA